MIKNQPTHEIKIKEKTTIENSDHTLKPLLTVKDLDEYMLSNPDSFKLYAEVTNKTNKKKLPEQTKLIVIFLSFHINLFFVRTWMARYLPSCYFSFEINA